MGQLGQRKLPPRAEPGMAEGKTRADRGGEGKCGAHARSALSIKSGRSYTGCSSHVQDRDREQMN